MLPITPHHKRQLELAQQAKAAARAASGAFWDAVLDVTQPPTDPGSLTVDQAHAGLGLRHNDRDVFQGSYDDPNLPSWLSPYQPEPEQRPVDTYSAEREAAGVPDASDVSPGWVSSPARINPSPWHI